MPGNIPKRINKSYRKYHIENMRNAVEKVQSSSMSIREAAKKYNVPFSTLQWKAKQNIVTAKRSGPPSVLSTEEEKKLVKWIVDLSRAGFPVTKDQLLDAVQTFVIKTCRKTPFLEGRPSKHWYKAFLQRNPEICEKMSQNLTLRRALVSETSIRNWFDSIQSYLANRNMLNIDPKRIFNLDESGFLLAPTGTRVLVHKKDRAAYSVCYSDKENLTTLITGNAAGDLVTTLIVYPYQKIPPKVAQSFPSEGFKMAKSENGWMTSQVFIEFIKTVFYPWLVKNEIEFPVILYVDGHSSHINMELSDFCVEKDIILVALFPNSTHLLQPMDVAVFRSLKASYRKSVQQWKFENSEQGLSKHDFAPVLKNAIDAIDMKTILINGFKACGLCPFNPDVVDYTKLFNNSVGTTVDPQENNVNNTIGHAEFLGYFERHIDSTALKFFKNSDITKQWDGPVEYTELYNFWKQTKEYSDRSSVQRPSSPETSGFTGASDVNPVSNNFSLNHINEDSIEIVDESETPPVVVTNSIVDWNDSSEICDEGTSFLEDPLLINTNQHPELKENDDHHRIVEIVQEIPIIHTDEPSLGMTNEICKESMLGEPLDLSTQPLGLNNTHSEILDSTNTDKSTFINSKNQNTEVDESPKRRNLSESTHLISPTSNILECSTNVQPKRNIEHIASNEPAKPVTLTDVLINPAKVQKKKVKTKKPRNPYPLITGEEWRNIESKKQADKEDIANKKSEITRLKTQQDTIKREILEISQNMNQKQLVIQQEKAQLQILLIQKKQEKDIDKKNQLVSQIQDVEKLIAKYSEEKECYKKLKNEKQQEEKANREMQKKIRDQIGIINKQVHVQKEN